MIRNDHTSKSKIPLLIETGKEVVKPVLFDPMQVSGFSMDKYAKKRGKVTSRQNCEVLCLSETEFPCR